METKTNMVPLTADQRLSKSWPDQKHEADFKKFKRILKKKAAKFGNGNDKKELAVMYCWMTDYFANDPRSKTFQVHLKELRKIVTLKLLSDPILFEEGHSNFYTDIAEALMFLNGPSADANKIDACFMWLYKIGNDTSAVKRLHYYAYDYKNPPKKVMDDFWQMIEKQKSDKQKENAADILSEVRDKRVKERKHGVVPEVLELANYKMQERFQALKKENAMMKANFLKAESDMEQTLQEVSDKFERLQEENEKLKVHWEETQSEKEHSKMESIEKLKFCKMKTQR